MDSDLLRTFLAVQRTRHFAQAAEQLYLTPSAVSFRIRQLEAELGVSLFHRRRSNIQLTAAGERLVPHAEALLAAWQQTRLVVGGAAAASHLRLSLAAPPFWLQLLAGSGSGLLALAQQHCLTIDWLALQPAVHRTLREGRADLVVTADAEDDDGLTAIPLTRLDWRWYGQSAALPHLYIASAAGPWQPAERQPCAWRGLSLSAALALVANGTAAALLPASLVTAEVAPLLLAQLPGESQQWRALWRQDHEQAPLLTALAEQLMPTDF